MLVCCDLDGTLDANPPVMDALLAALHQAGHEVAILTGHHGAKTVTPDSIEMKQQRLAELGIGTYAQLVVFPDDGNLAEAKAAWIRQHGASLLIDNNRKNAKAAQNECMVLVPWATRL